jgi:AraC-like DNA-binding protein
MIEPLAVYYEHCEPGWYVPEAKTPNHILILLTSGSITYDVENQRFHLHKGDLLYVPQGIVRSATNHTDSTHEMYVAHFLYEGTGEGLPLLQQGAVQYIKLFQFEYMKQRFSLLTQHWLRKQLYTDTFCHSILLEMLAIVNEETDSNVNMNRSYSLVSQLQNHITMHYRHAITMEELASLVQRTPNYVSRLFKEATGKSVTEYIQQVRILAACDLLTNSQMNVGEVSDFLGFCEQSYFNKVFKRLTGTLPSTYMKEKVKLWKPLEQQRPST